MDLDRHEGMVLAAQFRALAVIDAFLGRLEPVFIEAAGNGVDLHAEGGNGPGVDDAFGIGGHDHLDDLVDRHDNRDVGRQQPGHRPFAAGPSA